jgi:hypothetical protein
VAHLTSDTWVSRVTNFSGLKFNELDVRRTDVRLFHRSWFNFNYALLFTGVSSCQCQLSDVAPESDPNAFVVVDATVSTLRKQASKARL